MIRNKISYIAFQKGMTIAELFLTTIHKSFKAYNLEKKVKKVATLDYK
jgi:hypothetical protein